MHFHHALSVVPYSFRYRFSSVGSILPWERRQAQHSPASCRPIHGKESLGIVWTIHNFWYFFLSKPVRDSSRGNITSNLEAVCVNKELDRIWDIHERFRGTTPGCLNGEIAILASYRSQDSYLQNYLRQPGRLLSNNSFRKSLRTLIGTVDSMQENECAIAIFSCASSNIRNSIRFLNDFRRFNDGTNRVRKLLVIIGDSTTFSHDNRWLHFWTECSSGRPYRSVEHLEVVHSDEDRVRIGQMQGQRNVSFFSTTCANEMLE